MNRMSATTFLSLYFLANMAPDCGFNITGLASNTAHNYFFEVLGDHKVIEYDQKQDRTPTTRLKTLLLTLSEYTIDLKYQKGSEMHTSDALSRLHNLTDTPDSKDVIPLNFLQHLAPNYIEHSYSHWTDKLYVHKTKDYNTTQVKIKCGRPPKQRTKHNISQMPAANTSTTDPDQHIKILILRLFPGI